MKIVHLVAGELTEGAARGAYWLHKAQISMGMESTLITSGVNDLGDSSVIAMGRSPWQIMKLEFLSRLANLPIRLFPGRLNRIFSTGFFGLNYKQYAAFKEADVIHLHWINGLVSMRSLRNIKKPIVWTLRDMWPLTGGCHYSMGCTRYQTGCGQCPQLASQSSKDPSHWVVANKRASLPKQLKIVGISTWLSECARQSKVFEGFPVQTISNNIDVSQFFPVDQEVARKALGLPLDKRIILAGAQNPEDFYKGFDLFLESLRLLDLSDAHVVFFGRVRPKDVAWLGDRYTSLGFLTDAVSLRLAYSCADVFVAPSREEAFGKTLAEALLCGTPVVCFDATGPADIVEHQVNGYKSVPYSSADLSSGVQWILNKSSDDYKKIRDSAGDLAARKFDSKVIAEQYMRLY